MTAKPRAKWDARLRKAAPAAKGLKVWGPTPAFYQVLRGRTRERLLVQAHRSVDVQAYLQAWLPRVKLPGSVRMTVDVDPVSFSEGFGSRIHL